MEVMQHVVRVESSFNPYAIGVVGGRLVRQPKTLPEALSTVRMLEEKGYNFSLGLAQVNRYNLKAYGLASYEQAFQPCANLKAGSRILAECHQRLKGDWGKAFSCYYSGNAVTGFRHGYVQKVFSSMASEPAADGSIRVIGKPSRKVVAVTRYPLHGTEPERISTAVSAAATHAPVAAAVSTTSVQGATRLASTGAEIPSPGVGSVDDAFVF
jgi:type IV secretion system protein VirB1